jgi:hypothetical protein
MNFKSKVCRKTRRSCLVKVRRVKWNKSPLLWGRGLKLYTLRRKDYE